MEEKVKTGTEAEVSASPVAKTRMGASAIGNSAQREALLIDARWRHLDRLWRHKGFDKNIGSVFYSDAERFEEQLSVVDSLDTYGPDEPNPADMARPLLEQTIEFIRKRRTRGLEYHPTEHDEVMAYHFVSIGLEPLAEALLSKDWGGMSREVARVLEYYYGDGMMMAAAYAAKQIVDERTC